MGDDNISVDCINQEDLDVYKEDMKKLMSYTGLTEESLGALKEKFKEKGWWGLFCDRKVSEKDIWFFCFFTLYSSDKDAVIEDIKNFEEAFNDLCLRVKDILKCEGVIQIQELRKIFKKLINEAKLKKRDTESRAAHRICQDIIGEEPDILRRLDRVEVFLQRKSFLELKKYLARAQEVARENDKTVDELKSINASLVSRCEEMRRDLKISLEENQALQDTVKNTVQLNEDLVKNSEKLNADMQNSLDESSKLRDSVRELMEQLKKD